MTRRTTISLYIIALAGLFVVSSTAAAETKIDPFFDAMAKMQGAGAAKAMALGSGASSNTISAFIKTRDLNATKRAVEDIGGSVRVVIAGDLITAALPLERVSELENHDDIVFIEAGKPIKARNDVALAEVGGDEVHAGRDLPAGYTGAGVIVGIVDTGIDLTHDDFLNSAGASRIIYAWDQQASGGKGPEEITTTYGVECDAAKIASGACPLRDTEGHGTHIAGTVAGRDEVYGGVAPDADIIAVRYSSELIIDGYATPIFSTTICEAAYYVFKKAESLGKPAVLNLSLGTHIGAHDGTSLFEQCLDALVAGSSGRAIVAAAGNEHISHTLYKGLHAGYDVSGKQATNFRIKSLEQGRIFYLDTWLDLGSAIAFGLRARDAATGKIFGTTALIAAGDTATGSFDGGKLQWQINATETASPLNGRPHVGITIMLGDTVKNPQNYDFDLLLEGTGHFDAWWYPDKSSSSVLFTEAEGTADGGYTYVAGDDRMNVAMPATAKNVIAVGGYASRTQWDKGSGCCQVSFTLDNILPFSSIGPSADPDYTGQKPEITAPGAMIASARSKDAPNDAMLNLADGTHTLAAGTSMATAFVSGTIALMFSADATYTFEDARRYLTQSAYVDSFVGAAPNNVWGYGKLDILSAVQTAVLGGPTGSASANASVAAPGGSSGSGSCTLTMLGTSEPATHMIPALLSVLSMAAVIWTTRKNREGRGKKIKNEGRRMKDEGR